MFELQFNFRLTNRHFYVVKVNVQPSIYQYTQNMQFQFKRLLNMYDQGEKIQETLHLE